MGNRQSTVGIVDAAALNRLPNACSPLPAPGSLPRGVIVGCAVISHVTTNGTPDQPATTNGI